MAVDYSFLCGDDTVKTEDADFIASCQVNSSLHYTERKIIS